MIALNTRTADRFTPPPGPEKGYPATPRKRMRFFDAYDRDHATKPIDQICLDEKVGESTGRYWLRQPCAIHVTCTKIVLLHSQSAPLISQQTSKELYF